MRTLWQRKTQRLNIAPEQESVFSVSDRLGDEMKRKNQTQTSLKSDSDESEIRLRRV